MKKYINKLFYLIILASLSILVSCEENNDNILVGTGNVAITDIIPNIEYPEETITIQGNDFDIVQFVFLGEQQVEFQLNENIISFVIPKNTPPGMTPVTLAMAQNYRVASEMEILQRPNPVISTISPTAAEPGENVTITGINLNNIETVKVSGFDANVVSSSATELILTVPSGPQNNTLSTIEVTTSGGIVESESIFYVGENLVANGTLELGSGDDFTNWGKFNGGDGLIASDDPYAGRSLKAIAAGGDAWRTQFVSDPTETSIGVDYIVNIWIKAESEGGNIRFSTNSTAGALYSGNYDISTEWQQIEWTFTNNDPATRLVLDMGVSTGAIYHVDNITLVSTLSGPPPAPNLVANGDLELGDADNFTNWGEFNGPELMTVETTEVHGGSRALKAIGAGQDAWRTQFASDPMTVEVDASYTAKIWIKSAAGGNMRFSTNSTTGALYSGNYDIGTEWQQIEWTFTNNDPASRLVLDLGSVKDAVYYVDDIEVRKN